VTANAGKLTRGTRTLAWQVSEALRQAILSGDYTPGDKLPSEAQLTEIHGVSRTVVREAVAALRADHLVEARKGAGVFVLMPAGDARPTPVIDKARLASDLEILEIRTPIEVEAAGLAAVRRSPSHEEMILDRHAAVLACIEAGSSIRAADFALHLAIADATYNPLFREFLEQRGASVIPQSKPVAEDKREADAYRRLIYREHEAIVLAISNGDRDAARHAMQQHLEGSQIRYRELLRIERMRQSQTSE
jgi:GntR family transcriptional regulator, transcriptional repressor for pyruvate dehydrogenase complex